MVAQMQYNLTSLPTWVASDGTHVENYDGYPRWSGRRQMARGTGFENPPAIGTRVLVNFNGFGLGTVRGYFVEHGWLGLYVHVDKRPDWHVKQNPGDRDPMVFGVEVFVAPAVLLGRPKGGWKRHVALEGHDTALCGFKAKAWITLTNDLAPNGNGHGCPKCLAHPSASYLAYFTNQLAAQRGVSC